jgi:hypothetical protein
MSFVYHEDEKFAATNLSVRGDQPLAGQREMALLFLSLFTNLAEGDFRKYGPEGIYPMGGSSLS